MDSPLVSVIIPAYNAEKYLRRCLDSIFAQTFSDFEVIIINDGSNDHTLDIILSYSELYPSKMRIINKLNGGQGAARNEGMKLARGKYIAFVDADDYVSEAFLAELYSEAEKENADMVICNYALVRQSNVVKSVKPKIPKDSKDMLVDPDVVPWKQLWKAKTIIDSGVIFAEKLFYEDTAFYLMIAPSIKKIAAVNKELYYYVDNGTSTVHGKQDKKVGHIFDVMNQVYGYYVNNGFLKKYQDELEYAYVKILLCSSVGRICQLGDANLRRKFLQDTVRNIECHFPNYRKNKYLKTGVKSLYIKAVNQNNIEFFAKLIKISSGYQLFSIHR